MNTARIQTSDLLSSEVVVFEEQSSSRISSRLDQKSSLKNESDSENHSFDDESPTQSPEETIDGMISMQPSLTIATISHNYFSF